MPTHYIRFIRYLFLTATLALLLAPLKLSAQQDSLPRQAHPWEDYIEEQRHLGLLSDEEATEIQQLYDELSQAPLDINQLLPEELQRIPFVRDIQITHFIDYRRLYGPFRELGDLKLIQGWDSRLISLLLPVLTCSPPSGVEHRGGEGRLEVGGRASTRQLSPQRQSYLGGNSALLLRLHYRSGRASSLYISAEKDAGEPWSYDRHRGFDSYNLHWVLSERGLLRQFVLGDYRVSRGCGLLLGQGVYPMSFRVLSPRLPEGIRPLRSSTESDFSRGIALEMGQERWRIGAFASSRSLDGRIDEEGHIVGLSETGLHRTPTEWRHRRKIPSRLLGGWIEYRASRGHISLQALYHDWRRYPLAVATGASHRPHLRGLTSSSALSLSYGWQSRQGHLRLSGELSRNMLGAWALIQHLSLQQMTLGDARFSYWRIAPDYWSYYGRSGTHSLRPNDEEGIRALWSPPLPIRALQLQLYAGGYRRLSERDSLTPRHRGWDYGAHLELGVDRAGSTLLLASLRERQLAVGDRAQRLSLGLRHEGEGWTGALTYSWTKAKSSPSWAVLADVRLSLGDQLRVGLFADYFRAQDWQARLYAAHPRVRYEYTSTLLFGEGFDVGMRLRWQPSYAYTLEAKLLHQHQRVETRPSMTLAVLTLHYRH